MKVRRDIYLNTPATGLTHAADCVVDEVHGVAERVGFRYRSTYLAQRGALPLDPVALPLTEGETVFSCRGGIPGFLDDYLPDDWGRRVLARAAFDDGDADFDANSVADLLTRMGGAHIGALALGPPGDPPEFDLGAPLHALAEVEEEAASADGLGEADRLLRLAEAASSVGGARPKALLFDAHGCYLAKFNRRHGDGYNCARVELACLEMARAAGLEAATGRVTRTGAGREVLLLDRFDVCGDARHHLISVNGLLKDPRSQRDLGRAFRYDDVADLIRRYSCRVEVDLPALLRLAAFNRAINNTDDHERNFSLIHRGAGYCLSPAYDLTPSLALGAYHAAGFGYDPSPPRPDALTSMGRVFGLSKPEVRRCAEEVAGAVGQWPTFAEQAGVEAEEMIRIARCFSHRPP